jgi:small redox-active disulfide protein 2
MKVKVLGSGCSSCHRVHDIVRQVITELNLEDATIQDVTDIREIMRYPIMYTPALVIDEKVVCAGRIPSKAEVTTWLTTALMA